MRRVTSDDCRLNPITVLGLNGFGKFWARANPSIVPRPSSFVDVEDDGSTISVKRGSEALSGKSERNAKLRSAAKAVVVPVTASRTDISQPAGKVDELSEITKSPPRVAWMASGSSIVSRMSGR